MLACVNGLDPVADAPPAAHAQNYLSGLADADQQPVAGMIAAGRNLAKENPQVGLSTKEYDRQRAIFVEKFYPANARGFLWPPTSQTVIKRFNGFWNDALTAIGVAAQRGRGRGGLKFSSDDYQAAIRAYVADSARAGKSPVFTGYADWLKRTGNSGKLPSGAAIRQRFGSWKKALHSAG